MLFVGGHLTVSLRFVETLCSMRSKLLRTVVRTWAGNASMRSSRWRTRRLGLRAGLGPLAGWLEQVVGGYVERGGEAENHVGIEAKLAAFVVGDESLDEAGFFGEFDLGEATFAAEAGETLAWRFVAGGQREECQFGRLRHDGNQCRMG